MQTTSVHQQKIKTSYTINYLALFLHRTNSTKLDADHFRSSADDMNLQYNFDNLQNATHWKQSKEIQWTT
jgi:hypothetical protein